VEMCVWRRSLKVASNARGGGLVRGRRRNRSDSDKWTVRDDMLVWSCRVAADVQAGRPREQLPRLSAPFPPVFDADEQVVAIGPFQLSDYRALGDGSWSVPGYVAVGSPGFMVGTVVGHLLVKRRARAEAAAAAVPRWVPIGHGTLFVTLHGWHMYTPTLLSWSWAGMTAAAMVGPGAMHLSGDSDHGPVSWVLHSDWAELVFALWALVRCPQHPQLITGEWLPPGWVERARRHQAGHPRGAELIIPQ
jgi:hypothetical protein